ncbi:YfhO family protein [Neobacillus niacini]|uniref:YfhO family protein n=1 Tax=Neobacillus niacini TaxID=86668 RepID=UPI002FFF9FAF
MILKTLGWKKINVTIQFLVTETQLTQNMFYALDVAKFEQRIQQIKAESIEVMSWTDTSIKGKINVTKPDMLFFSIPFDNGWRVEIDGESVPVSKLGGFIGVNVEHGQHIVELHYKPKGFNLGVVISIFSLFTFGLLSFLDLVKKKTLKIKWDKGI